MEAIFFYIFAVLAVGSGFAVVAFKKPVHSALALMTCFIQIAALFVMLRSPFLAAVQVFIYVGAVMVLFLFAVMVLDLSKESLSDYLHDQKPVAFIIVAALFAVAGFAVIKGNITAPPGIYTEESMMKNTELFGELLFTRYLFPFEVVSLLLLVALIGAIALTMKEKK